MKQIPESSESLRLKEIVNKIDYLLDAARNLVSVGECDTAKKVLKKISTAIKEIK